MAPYTDPALVDHAEGLEQRIIELGAQIDHLDANHATWQDADQLRRRRRQLVEELAETSSALTQPGRIHPVSVDAEHVVATDGR